MILFYFCLFISATSQPADLSVSHSVLNGRTVPFDPQRSSIDSLANPLNPTNVFHLNTVTNAQQPGVATDRNIYGFNMNQSPRITYQHLKGMDWSQIDRRAEEGKSFYKFHSL